MPKLNLPAHIEFYPDGEVIVFDDNCNTILSLKKDEVIKSMIKNLNSCDWLSFSDMKTFGEDLIAHAKEPKKKQNIPHPKFILKKAKNGQYYFTLSAKNGQVIAQSEMYNCKDAAENGIRSVKESAAVAETDDQTEEV